MGQPVADSRATSVLQDESPEARHAPRVTLLIRTARLADDRGEVPCIIRDVSCTGVRLRLFGDIEAEGRMALLLGNGESFPIECMWERDGEAGFRFLSPVDVPHFIQEPSAFPRRPMRLRLEVPARLICEDRVMEGRMWDLSQQGARITTGAFLAVGQKVAIEASGMEPRIGSVCWRRRQAHGLVFQQALTLAELAELALDMAQNEMSGSAIRQA